jgi:hypothetical protein
VAGNKAGNWRKWYETAVPKADDAFDAWLEGLGGSGRGRRYTFSGDADAADWWYGVGTAAMTASLCYVDESGTTP